MAFLRKILLVGMLLPMGAVAQDIDAQFQQARAAEVAGNWNEAADIYRALIIAIPNQGRGYFELSKASFHIDDLRGAQQNIRTAIEKDQRNEEYRAHAEVVGKITNGLKEGRRSQDNRDYASAVAGYDRLIAEYPYFATLYYYRGLSLQGDARIDDAVEAFGTAASMNPSQTKYTKALRALAVREYKEGERFYRIKDWAPAQDHYAKSLAIDPKFDQGYYRLAKVMSRQGDISGALSTLNKSIASNPAYLTAHLEKGNILRGEQRYSDAAKAYRGALTVDSGSYRAMVGLGQSLKADKPTEASKHLISALEIKPDNVTANELLGEIFTEQEKYKDAQPYLAKAVELKSDDHIKLWRLAHVENKLENWESAKDHARASVGIEDKFQAAWYELGIARKQLDEIPGAIQAFKKAETGSDRSTAADASRERKQIESRGR